MVLKSSLTHSKVLTFIKKNMKLLIIEPNADGHHFLPYLQYFAVAAQNAGISIQLMTTAGAAAHPAMATVQSALAKPMPVVLMPDAPPIRSGSTLALFARQRVAYKTVVQGYSAIAKADRPSHILLMCMDGFDRWFALFGSPFGNISYSGLHIGLKFHLNKLGFAPAGRLARVNQWLFTRLLKHKTLFAAASIDESLLTFYANQPKLLKKLRFVPDPGEVGLTESPKFARSQLAIAPEQFALMTYGGIGMRKNLGLLLQCAAQIPEIILILAGRMEAEARQLCQNSPFAETLRVENRFLCFDQFIEPALESRLFAATDCVWLCYSPDFYGQSAVLAQSASAGKPILGRKGGQIGYITELHKLGPTAAPDDASEIAAKLRQLIDDTALRQQFSENAAKFAPSRNAAAFGSAMLRCIPSYCFPGGYSSTVNSPIS